MVLLCHYHLLSPPDAGSTTGLEIVHASAVPGTPSCLAWGQMSIESSSLGLMGVNSVAQKKKYELVFFLTAGLDNDVKMTLSLINVICREIVDHPPWVAETRISR